MRNPIIVRPLPSLNDNYDPPRPWACITHSAHVCDGPVVAAVGSIPVCLNGAAAEFASRVADDKRIAALMATPEMQAEMAREQAWEARVS